MPAHPLEPPAKNSKPWLDEGDVLIIYSKHKEPLPPSVAIVVRLHAIPQAIANAACESLDKEIGRKREEGALEAGKLSSVMLEWTTRTREVIDIFGIAFKVVCANLESNSQSSGANTISLRILHLSKVSVATQEAPSNGLVQ